MSREELIRDGYFPYGIIMNGDPIDWIPPRGKLLIWNRPEWTAPHLAMVEELHPHMNIAGLMWKRSGISLQ